jgi:prepilin signal peptidase PulO-like enzyme (type II secretory pathway)
MTLTHHGVLLLLWTILGSCVGSFLNVCVHRIPRRMSLLRPRSRCPRCGSPIRARDNIPVLGWLILGGRCRECRGPIPARYPAVELAVGAVFALPYLVAVAVAVGDPWERIGAERLLAILLATWTASGVGILVMLVGCETRWTFTGHRAGGGCEGPASSALRPRAGPD